MNTITAAIQNRQPLRFFYDGHMRIVEPHTYGVDVRGHDALRAYQVAGGSSSGEFIGWKLFHVSEMGAITLLEDRFSGPRAEYKRGDKVFRTIVAQL